jgi:hypothetical protein
MLSLRAASAVIARKPLCVSVSRKPDELGEEHRRLQADPTQPRQSWTAEETASEHDVEIVFFQTSSIS